MQTLHPQCLQLLFAASRGDGGDGGDDDDNSSSYRRASDYGPLLFPPCDHPSAIPTLLPHIDDGVFLPQELHDSTFEQRAQLLYLNWHVLHGVDALLDIKKWLESLSKEDHLLFESRRSVCKRSLCHRS